MLKNLKLSQSCLLLRHLAKLLILSLAIWRMWVKSWGVFSTHAKICPKTRLFAANGPSRVDAWQVAPTRLHLTAKTDSRCEWISLWTKSRHLHLSTHIVQSIFVSSNCQLSLPSQKFRFYPAGRALWSNLPADGHLRDRQCFHPYCLTLWIFSQQGPSSLYTWFHFSFVVTSDYWSDFAANLAKVCLCRTGCVYPDSY